MAEWRRVSSVAPSHHLPPMEHLTGFKVHPGSNKPIAIEKLPTPLDEFGRPDLLATIDLISSHVSPEYNWGHDYNEHHGCWPHDLYRRDPVLSHFRGSRYMKEFLSVTAHNMKHALTLPPPVVSYEVARQHLAEERSERRLFRIGRNIIQNVRTAERLRDEELVDYWDMYIDISYLQLDEFYREIEAAPEPMLGIVPTKEHMMSSNLYELVKQLGKTAARQNTDHRREAHYALNSRKGTMEDAA